ncbi:MAG: hypothetical protein ACLFQA_01105 [Bacteroidales bacterium]
MNNQHLCLIAYSPVYVTLTDFADRWKMSINGQHVQKQTKDDGNGIVRKRSISEFQSETPLQKKMAVIYYSVKRNFKLQ